MKYEMFRIDGSILRPSDKAMKENRIPEYWDFYLSDLSKVTEVNGLANISKPVFDISKRVIKERQIDFLLELISVVKEFDLENKVDWKTQISW